MALPAIAAPARADFARFGYVDCGKQEPELSLIRVWPPRHYCPPWQDDAPVLDLALDAPTMPVSRNATGAKAIPIIRMVAALYQDHRALKRLNLTPKEWTVLFQAMVRVESNYRKTAVSRVVAIGLAKLMPETARMLRVDPHDPVQNLDGGARYLLTQLDRFGNLQLALAAYNAGPDAVQKYRGIPPYQETQSHILKVVSEYDRLLRNL